MNPYPTDKIKELNAYILNFHQDVITMNAIVENMTKWHDRGIAVEAALVPLQSQIASWKSTMDGQLMRFKTNLVMLKELDDRVRSSIKIDLDITPEYDGIVVPSTRSDTDGSNGGHGAEEADGSNGADGSKGAAVVHNVDAMGSWESLYVTYTNLFVNLNEDIDVLQEAHKAITGYASLGIELKSALDTIDSQIKKINNGIQSSISELDEIIENIKKVSMMVLSDDEIQSMHVNIIKE